MKIITKKLFLTVTILALLLTTNVVFASNSITNQAGGGLNTAVQEAYGGGNKVNVNEGTFTQGLVIIINNLLTFIGILFFLLIIYAGYLWMTARGNQEQVEKAKKITREAVIGLLIIILARIFTEFILSQVGSAVQE